MRLMIRIRKLGALGAGIWFLAGCARVPGVLAQVTHGGVDFVGSEAGRDG